MSTKNNRWLKFGFQWFKIVPFKGLVVIVSKGNMVYLSYYSQSINLLNECWWEKYTATIVYSF